MPSTHRLGRGLHGYLIRFAPHAFVSQRQYIPRQLATPLVFPMISTHFTATPCIPISPPALEPRSLGRTFRVEPGDFTPHTRGRLRALYAQ